MLLTAAGLFLYPSTAQWAVWFGASAEVGTLASQLATALIGLAGRRTWCGLRGSTPASVRATRR